MHIEFLTKSPLIQPAILRDKFFDKCPVNRPTNCSEGRSITGDGKSFLISVVGVQIEFQRKLPSHVPKRPCCSYKTGKQSRSPICASKPPQLAS